MTESRNAELSLEIRQLRDRLRELAAAPPQPPQEVVRAQERMAGLESRLAATHELVERIQLEREIAAVALASANEVRAHTEQRRLHRRALSDARRELYDHVLPLHEELIAATKSRISSLLSNALDDLNRLESQRSALVEQTIPVAVDEAGLPTLRRMLLSAHKLAGARRVR